MIGCGSNNRSNDSSISQSSSSEFASASSSAGVDIYGSLNDTGVAICASEDESNLDCPQSSFPSQDGDLGRDALARTGQLDKIGGGSFGFDWTKLDAQGNPLVIQDQPWNDAGNESSGEHWSCIRDNVTGLVWEVKESDPADPRYGEHLYSWYLTDPSNNGGYPGYDQLGAEQCGTPPCHTESYVTWVNAQGLCGHDDWRLPSANELLSIAVVSNVLPALDQHYFPNADKPRFFTRHSLANDPMRAWYVYFSDASVSFTNKSDGSHVRLVRGGHNE